MKNKTLIILSLFLLLLISTFISAFAENSDVDISNVQSEESELFEDISMSDSSDFDNENSLNESSKNEIDESNSANESIDQSIVPSEPEDESIDNNYDSSIEESFDDTSNFDTSDDSYDQSDANSDDQSKLEEDQSEIFSDNESINTPSNDESKNEESDDTSTNISISESVENSSDDESFDLPSNDESIDNPQDESINEEISTPIAEKLYMISVTQTNGGRVQVNKTSAKKGETITISITENNGYDLFSITVNGKSISRNSFIMPDSDVEIIVKFIKTQTEETSKPTNSKTEDSSPPQTESKEENSSQNTSKPEKKYYNVTTFISGEGNVSVDKTSAQQGTRIIITVKPAEGYKLEYIEFNGNKITEIGEKYAFVMPAKNVTVKANFIKIEDNSSKDEISSPAPSDSSTDNSVFDESDIISNEESMSISTDESNNADTSDDTSIYVNSSDIENSHYFETSLFEDDPSSPLLFIVPIVIAIAMICSITSFFVRKYGNS